MSRAVIVAATGQAVSDLCEKHSIPISTIEPLPAGGTRVVLNNSIDAKKVRDSFKGKVIEGPVTRSPLYACRALTPYS
jgi:hypothetical protein